MSIRQSFFFFFFNDTATTEIYTLSLHDALPISFCRRHFSSRSAMRFRRASPIEWPRVSLRSEEHTSELQSQSNLVCRLLLEKKKNEFLRISSSTQSHYHITPPALALSTISSLR